jgi:pimeloyl-ACP methyl ester carboxylesterase
MNENTDGAKTQTSSLSCTSASLAFMQNHIFTYQRFQLSYLEWGCGTQIILCFHGFGRQASDFELFESQLLPSQKLIAIDLFYHGESQANTSAPLDPHHLTAAEWQELLSAFLDTQKCRNFHLMGYSMGGRIALCTYQWMPERVLSLTLFATDGLKKNLVYRFASSTVLGRNLFRHFIKNPAILFKAASILHRFKLLHPKLFRFVHVHLDTLAKRQLVYDAWLIYRPFFPKLSQVGAIHASNTIPLHLVFGQNDSVIKPKLSENIAKHFHTSLGIWVIESGHRLLNPLLLDFIQKHQLWPKESSAVDVLR